VAEALVIGVGNDLRGDDGAGHAVADRIDALGVPGVAVRSVSQLVPELVEQMADAALVVIVDADIDAAEVVVRTAKPGVDSPISHHGSPEALVALAATLGMSLPEVVVVGVPAVSFGLGEGLSESAASMVEDAVAVVSVILSGPGVRER
jgi:hydrogenase maturation protease